MKVFLLLVVIVFPACAYIQSPGTFERDEERVVINDTPENALRYSSIDFVNTYYLGFRDLPEIIEKYVRGTRVLDYGCGAGRSTRFLKGLGLDPIGVDISSDMLALASKHHDLCHYLKIESGKMPLLSDSYDMIFCGFVLFTIESKQELLCIFKEMQRCLRPGGIAIMVTGSDQLYLHPWASYESDPNGELVSGKAVEIHLKDAQIRFVNYYWPEEEMRELYEEAGFRLLESHHPLGRADEPYDWVSEEEFSPYVVHILRA